MRRLNEHEHIVGAWAERCSGPGWSNRLLWVCIRDARDGTHRIDAFQPEEHPLTVTVAFGMLASASSFMLAEAGAMADEQRKPTKRPRAKKSSADPGRGR